MPSDFIELDNIKEALVESLINNVDLDNVEIELDGLNLDIDYDVVIKIKNISLYKEPKKEMNYDDESHPRDPYH